jgi:hypothetical protein
MTTYSVVAARMAIGSAALALAALAALHLLKRFSALDAESGKPLWDTGSRPSERAVRSQHCDRVIPEKTT